MRGLFITFEGIEGCGKSTQVQRLGNHLTRQGYRVITTREPGDGELGSKIRELLLSVSSNLDPRTELFLLAADRTRHVIEIIEPELAAGAIVISDRYTDSSVAYQGHGRGLALDFIHSINQSATRGLDPDLTFVMDIAPEISVERSQIRLRQQNMFEAEGRFENENLQFHHRVRDGYRSIAREEPGRVRLIDAGHSIEAISSSIEVMVDQQIIQWRKAANSHA
ncbi:dTMP kinase [bacterium]|nr:dTMP kinase [candidate division CSSED10-310 bacterium]